MQGAVESGLAAMRTQSGKAAIGLPGRVIMENLGQCVLAYTGVLFLARFVAARHRKVLLVHVGTWITHTRSSQSRDAS